jgi:hypothetical protein
VGCCGCEMTLGMSGPRCSSGQRSSTLMLIGYDVAIEFSEKQREHYPADTRYHIRKLRMDAVLPVWVSCDDEDFKGC